MNPSTLTNLAYLKSTQALSQGITKAEMSSALEAKADKEATQEALEAKATKSELATKADRFSGYSGEVAIGDKRLRFENGILKGVS